MDSEILSFQENLVRICLEIYKEIGSFGPEKLYQNALSYELKQLYTNKYHIVEEDKIPIYSPPKPPNLTKSQSKSQSKSQFINSQKKTDDSNRWDRGKSPSSLPRREIKNHLDLEDMAEGEKNGGRRSHFGFLSVRLFS